MALCSCVASSGALYAMPLVPQPQRGAVHQGDERKGSKADFVEVRNVRLFEAYLYIDNPVEQGTQRAITTIHLYHDSSNVIWQEIF
jgi:hypothetical protein